MIGTRTFLLGVIALLVASSVSSGERRHAMGIAHEEQKSDGVEKFLHDKRSSSCSNYEIGGTWWDFTFYVARWPGTYTQEEVPDYVNTFTMHGLWPTLTNGSYPGNCFDQSFSTDSIEDLVYDLRRAWTDFSGPNSTSLWDHEWGKHGTCACYDDETGIDTQHDFFSLGIDLHDQYDIRAVLEDADIVPGDDKSYSYDDIINALNAGFNNTQPIISCEDDNILRVYLCLDRDWNPTMCPPEIYHTGFECSGCPKDGIGYPYINYYN